MATKATQWTARILTACTAGMLAIVPTSPGNASDPAAGSPASAPAQERAEREVLEARVHSLPPGYELQAETSEEAPGIDGAGTYLYDVQRFEKKGAAEHRGELLRVEVATSTSGSWRAYEQAASVLDEAAPAGDVGGRPARFSGAHRTGGEKTSLTWIADDYTQVTISSTSATRRAMPQRALLALARTIELVPSGRTVDGSAEPAPSEDTIYAMASTGCSSSCPSSTNMDGISTLTDDWGPDEMILRNGGTYHQGNLAGVWQAILWADRASTLYVSDGGTATNCDVDGVFGSRTYELTRWWQHYRFSPSGTGGPMAGDGIVGSTTWSYADNQLRSSGPYVIYDGLYRDLYFTRSTYASGHYTWSWNNSPYYYTGYSGRQIVRTTSNCSIA